MNIIHFFELCMEAENNNNLRALFLSCTSFAFDPLPLLLRLCVFAQYLLKPLKPLDGRFLSQVTF